jgi:NhaP-type Na+/H+ or K+/H+ antiporter
MKTFGKIYFLFNAFAFIYLGFTLEHMDGSQLFFLGFLVSICLFGAYIIYSNEKWEKEIDEQIKNKL